MSEGSSPTHPLQAFDDPDGAAAKHMSFVGMVASAWAELEFAIDSCATDVADIPRDISVCFTAQIIGSNRKIDAYIALVRLRGVNRYNADLELFAKDTASLAERRNRVIHDPWMTTGRAHPARLEATARRALRFQFVEVPTAEVIALGDEIIKHTGRFAELHTKVMAVIGTSR
jgi:hypothetical protein